MSGEVIYGRESVNGHLSGMQREGVHYLSGMPRTGKTAKQHGDAAAVHELPREGDERVYRLPGGEESGREVDRDTRAESGSSQEQR